LCPLFFINLRWVTQLLPPLKGIEQECVQVPIPTSKKKSVSRQMCGVRSLMFITHHFVVRWYQAGYYFHNGISWHIGKYGTGMSRSRMGFNRLVSNADNEPSALLLWGQNGCTTRAISSFGILKWNSLCGAINITRNQFYGWQNIWVTRSTNLWSYSCPQNVRSSEVCVTFFQSAYMFSLPTSLLPQTMCCTLWTGCHTKSFHIKRKVSFPYIEGALKTQLQSPIDPCLTECTLTNLTFKNFTSSLHRPGNLNPSVHCTDLQFFWSHTRRCNVDSWTHLWALQISNPKDLGSSMNLKFSVAEACISATHDGQC
jgi:hypothetical protein